MQANGLGGWGGRILSQFGIVLKGQTVALPRFQCLHSDCSGVLGGVNEQMAGWLGMARCTPTIRSCPPFKWQEQQGVLLQKRSAGIRSRRRFVPQAAAAVRQARRASLCASRRAWPTAGRTRRRQLDLPFLARSSRPRVSSASTVSVTGQTGLG